MHIGAAKVELYIHASFSLKDKRRVVHSVISQLRNRHSVSAAEVFPNNTWQSTTIGITVVSGNLRTLDQQLEKVLAFIEHAAPEAEVTSVETDVWSFDAM